MAASRCVPATPPARLGACFFSSLLFTVFMPPLFKLLLLAGGGLLVLAALGYGYYLYAPLPPLPRLSAALQAATIRVGGHARTYRAYVPAGLPPHAPLVLVLHGSNIDGVTMRQWTGYEFDEQADRHGFAVLYPDGYKKNWNDCRRDATFAAKTENIDDVGFLRALVAKYQADLGIDPARVYAFGYSNGGQMAFRLAMEEPRLVAAIATTAANMPPPGSCSCPPEGPTARVLLVAGTQDPISPYAGGEVTLFGFGSRGQALSARATAEEFARRNGVAAPPVAATLPHQRAADPTSVERLSWARGTEPAVVLYSVRGGGHVVPQPRYRFGRLLGRTTGDLDAPVEALRFFDLLPVEEGVG